MSVLEQIGKYRVIAEIGRGGMARVLLTVASGPAGFEKLLVVKVLLPELAQDSEFRAMFLDEARLAARLNHPNVVQTYEVGSEGAVFYIAMDYLEGQPLQSLLRKVGRGNVPLEVHVRILSDMLAGLDYAHTLADFDGTPLGVVHRDISPHNVFVTYDGQVKLVDFGIAKAAVVSGRTQKGVFKGKVTYTAPEQARAESVDARADIFPAGVMLFEALTRQRFAKGENEVAVLLGRTQGLEPRVRDVAPEAPEELAQICHRAMSFERNERFTSAAEMRDALERWLARQPARVGQKELGAFVAGAFSEERVVLRACIDKQLKHLRAGLGESLPLLRLGAGGPLPELWPSDRTPPHEHLTPSYESLRRLPGFTLSGTERVSLPPPRQSPLRPAIALICAMALGAATFFVTRSPAPRDVVQTASALAPGSVEISVRSVPAQARVSLDGAALEGNPARGRFSRDGAMHQIEVSAEGFRTERRVVSFERDHDLSLDLVRDEAAPAALAVPSAAEAPPPSAHPARPYERPTRLAPKAPQSTSRPSPKPQHLIDEQNPYAQ